MYLVFIYSSLHVSTFISCYVLENWYLHIVDSADHRIVTLCVVSSRRPWRTQRVACCELRSNCAIQYLVRASAPITSIWTAFLFVTWLPTCELWLFFFFFPMKVTWIRCLLRMYSPKNEARRSLLLIYNYFSLSFCFKEPILPLLVLQIWWNIPTLWNKEFLLSTDNKRRKWSSFRDVISLIFCKSGLYKLWFAGSMSEILFQVLASGPCKVSGLWTL
jgi:hypothetical protein